MPKKLIIANKEIKWCADCTVTKSFFDKIKHKSERDVILSLFLNKLNLIKHADLLRKV